MVRTQVLLDEEGYRWLKEQARETGSSLSALVRAAVAARREAGGGQPNDAVLALVGAFTDDRGDVSLRHDEYLARAADSV
jgi:hypothetical protein